MQKYKIIQKAGDGNFSIVYKAIDTTTQQIVAIKDMRKVEEVEELIWRQLKILASVKHPNIIKAKEIFQNGNDIKVVFQYISQNLLELYQNTRKGINENQIKCILYQVAFALDYLHTDKKIIHRDIKPENILIDKKQAIVKLIDFGLAKEEDKACTNYVATRWYRAPENLIGLSKSTTAIDIFALGCVIFELATLTPLFPGENTVDQLAKVFHILGSPTEETWLVGFKELKKKGIGVLEREKIDLKLLMPNTSNQLIDLLNKMLELDPEKRPKARDIMVHPFFDKVEKVIPTAIYIESKKYVEEVEKLKLNQYQTRQREIQLMRDISPNFKMNGVVHNRNKSQIKSSVIPELKPINPTFYPKSTCLPSYQQPNKLLNKSIEPRSTMNLPLYKLNYAPQSVLHNASFKNQIQNQNQNQNQSNRNGNEGEQKVIGINMLESKPQRSYREMDSFGGNRGVIMRSTFSTGNGPSIMNNVRNNYIKRIGF